MPMLSAFRPENAVGERFRPQEPDGNPAAALAFRQSGAHTSPHNCILPLHIIGL